MCAAVSDAAGESTDAVIVLSDGATELMVHPGYDDAVLAAQDNYRTQREREVAALCSVAVKERLARGDIRLVRFDEI